MKGQPFSAEFKPAYTVSNEDLRWVTSLTPNAKRVLTVAGSGDQALFYHLAGATTVHTFDHTRNAGIIQDIKTAAIGHMKRDEYFNALDKLHTCRKPTDIPEMATIMPRLPSATTQYITNPNSVWFRPFSMGCSPADYMEYQPTDAEYARLSATIKSPFKFILADLADLHKHIDGEYDVINLSNIFDDNYGISPMNQLEIMGRLTPYLRVGGHFVVHAQLNSKDYSKVEFTRRDNGMSVKFAGKIRKNPNKFNTDTVLMFQRTR